MCGRRMHLLGRSQLDFGPERWSLATASQLTKLPSEFFVAVGEVCCVGVSGDLRRGLVVGSSWLSDTVVVDRPSRVAVLPVVEDSTGVAALVSVCTTAGGRT